jgi:hypothetical protein
MLEGFTHTPGCFRRGDNPPAMVALSFKAGVRDSNYNIPPGV